MTLTEALTSFNILLIVTIIAITLMVIADQLMRRNKRDKK